jgi:hypothetical protein
MAEQISEFEWRAVPIGALEDLEGHGGGMVARLTAGTGGPARASSDADDQALQRTRDRRGRHCATCL